MILETSVLVSRIPFDKLNTERPEYYKADKEKWMLFEFALPCRMYSVFVKNKICDE